MIKRIIRKILNLARGGNQEPPKSYIDQLEERGLVIGRTSKPTIHSHCIDGLYPWLIEIGEHVVVSTNCQILAHDASTATICGFSKLGRVTIGDYVYIGHNSTVLCNVQIGDNVVVGAGSLVNKNLASNGVYAGVPARFICSIEDFKRKNIEARNNKPFFEKNFIYWQQEATAEEKQEMKELLKDSYGYIQSRIIE